jgi:hypothetical protein
MLEFSDPVTDESYDPIGDPGGTAMKAVSYVLGIAMTALLVGVALNTVLPTAGGFVERLTGVDTGGNSGPLQFGDP